MARKTEVVNSQVADSMQKVTDEIIAYAEDDRHHYALALEGAWGSGKTRYVEAVLRPALKGKKIRMVRVSLFGVRSPEAVYEKVALAILPLSGKRNDKKFAQSLVGEMAKNAKRCAPWLNGIDISDAFWQRSLVELAAKMHLFIVFDDLERLSGECDSTALFGLVNDLVENMKCHVLFVWNPNEGFEKMDEIRDKLIWREVRFKPKPADLAKDILLGVVPDGMRFDAGATIVSAAEEIGCDNARAMIRASILIEGLCRLELFRGNEFSPDNMSNAFRDVVAYALENSMGGVTEGQEADYEDASAFSGLTRFARRQSARERILAVPQLGRCIECPLGFKVDTFEESLREYLIKTYPEATDTTLLEGVLRKLETVAWMGDEEADAMVSSYNSLMLKANFSPSVIYDAVQFSCQLSDIGFRNVVSGDKLLASCKRVVSREPEYAYGLLSNRRSRYGFRGERSKNVLEELLEYAREQFHCYVDKLLDNIIKLDDSECGERLVEQFRDWEGVIPNAFAKVTPAKMLDVFLRSRPEGKEALSIYFSGLDSFLSGALDESSRHWLLEFGQLAKAAQPESPLDVMRLRWLNSVLDDLSAHMQVPDAGAND